MGTHESWDNNHHHHYKTIKHDFKNKNQREKFKGKSARNVKKAGSYISLS